MSFLSIGSSLDSFMCRFIKDFTINTRDSDWVQVLIKRKILNQKGTIHFTKHSGYCLDRNENEFIEELKNLFPKTVRKWRYNKTTREITDYYFCEESLMFAEIEIFGRQKQKQISVSITCANKKLFDQVYNLVHADLRREKGNEVYAIGTSQQGLVLQSLGIMRDPFIRGNYNEETNNSFDYIIKEYNDENPAGRIVIINGPPGCGKSYMIRGMIPRFEDALIILLPSRLVAELDGPSLVNLLTAYKEDYGYDENGNSVSKPLIFILEDADQCLVPRDDGNISQISALLNYTDGIFGSMLDIRIIATTNAESIEFDDAITRPGRLCKHINIGLLSPEEANKIYNRETEKDVCKYKNYVTLAQVYADAKNKDTSGAKKKVKKMGF